MIKHLFKLSLLTYGWKKYKSIVISTFILFAYFWLVDTLHEDFINFRQLNNSTEHLGLSFIIKWVLYITGCLGYYLINTRTNKNDKAYSVDSKATQESASKSKAKKVNKQSPTAENELSDPFKTIRNKEKLRSQADIIIDKNINKK